MKIIDLRTEGLVNSIGIDVVNPRLSWRIIESEHTKGKTFVYVSSEKEKLQLEDYDCWIYTADDNISCEYGGKKLENHCIYYWQVERNGVKSDIAMFETAYITEPFKNSKWIGIPMAYTSSTNVCRVDFNIDKPVKYARLYVAALGTGRYYVNGKLVSDDYFDGALSVYDKEVYYRTYAIDLKNGLNSISAEIGFGFFGAKIFRGEIFICYKDGEKSIIPTCEGRLWNFAEGRISGQSVYGGEIYNATVKDYTNPKESINTTEFVSAYRVTAPAGKLRANPIPPMKVVERFEPVHVVKKSNNNYFVDAGVNICGWLKICMEAKRGTKIIIRYAEVADENLNINQTNLRTAKNTDIYIAKGGRKETYAPSFTYHGFRYAQIRIEGEADITNIIVEHLRTAVDKCSTFSCSDSTLNKLHEIAVRTESNNLNGVFSDCPQRDERLGWLNDMTSRIFESICNFDLRCFLPHFVDMITQSQDKSGAFGDTVPFFVGSPVADAVDAYQILGLMAYRYYGDKNVLLRNYNGFCAWNEKLSEYKEDGVVSHELYGDWCPAFVYSKGGDGTHTAMVAEKFMSAAYYVWNISLTLEAAKILGKTEDIKRWSLEREISKKAFFKKFVDKNGKAGNGSQTECAVMMTVFKEEKELCKVWAKTAVNDIIGRNYHTTCGNQGYRHLIYRLSEYGYADIIFKMLTNKEYPGWGYMLKRGATTVWERWESDVSSDMHSFNHPMFAAYDGFFINYIVGLREDLCEDAFKHIVIKPCFIDGMDFAECTFVTVRGKIAIKWQRKGEKIHLDISTPFGTLLTVLADGKTINYENKHYIGEISLQCGDFSLLLE